MLYISETISSINLIEQHILIVLINLRFLSNIEKNIFCIKKLTMTSYTILNFNCAFYALYG